MQRMERKSNIWRDDMEEEVIGGGEEQFIIEDWFKFTLTLIAKLVSNIGK